MLKNILSALPNLFSESKKTPDQIIKYINTEIDELENQINTLIRVLNQTENKHRKITSNYQFMTIMGYIRIKTLSNKLKETQYNSIDFIEQYSKITKHKAFQDTGEIIPLENELLSKILKSIQSYKLFLTSKLRQENNSKIKNN
jgi:ferritin-like metal-binding protein YciE